MISARPVMKLVCYRRSIIAFHQTSSCAPLVVPFIFVDNFVIHLLRLSVLSGLSELIGPIMLCPDAKGEIADPFTSISPLT